MKDNTTECPRTLSEWTLVIDFMKENRWLIFLYILLVLFIPLHDVGLPHIFGKIMEAMKSKKEDQISFSIMLFIIVLLLVQGSFIVSDLVEVKIYPRIMHFIRNKVLHHIFMIAESENKEVQIGKIIPKLIKLPTLLYWWMNELRGNIVPKILVYIVAAIYFFVYDKIIGSVMVLLVVFLLISFYKVLKGCQNITMLQDRTSNEIHEEIDDVLRNISTVIGFNAEQRECDRIDKMHILYTRYSEMCLKCALSIRLYYVPLITGFMVITGLFLFRRVKKGTLSPSSFVSIFIIIFFITNSMYSFVNFVREASMKYGTIQECMEIFRVCQGIDLSSNEMQMPVPSNGIYLHNVYVYHETGSIINGDLNIHRRDEPSLKNVSAFIENGKCTVIHGHIGSGKTTLVKIILNQLKPTSGQVYLNGIPYSKYSKKQLRNTFVSVAQNPILMNRTLYENISYGQPDEAKQFITKESIHKIMDELNVQDLRNLDENVGKYGSKLSGGQRQIVCLIRALVLDPAFLVLDEPTASVDQDTKVIIKKAILKLKEKKTSIVLVTHDPYMKQLADAAIELRSGEVSRNILRV